MLVVIRLASIFYLLLMVYEEAGIWTAGAVFVLFLEKELLMASYIGHQKRVKEIFRGIMQMVEDKH